MPHRSKNEFKSNDGRCRVGQNNGTLRTNTAQAPVSPFKFKVVHNCTIAAGMVANTHTRNDQDRLSTHCASASAASQRLSAMADLISIALNTRVGFVNEFRKTSNKPFGYRPGRRTHNTIVRAPKSVSRSHTRYPLGRPIALYVLSGQRSR